MGLKGVSSMSRDHLIVELIAAGRLAVNAADGFVFAPKSNTPHKTCGAKTGKGYLRVCVTRSGKQLHFMAHRIVWVSVNGPLPDGWEVDHKNRVKTDNRLGNLEAVPGKENMRRAKVAGAFALCGAGNKSAPRDSKGRYRPRVGKKAAGRMLDGRTWDEFPRVKSLASPGEAK
jgi:hypothetical protein